MAGEMVPARAGTDPLMIGTTLAGSQSLERALP